jgi:N-acetylglucosaminyl-diphospho-decaprenol L-rhamnosyltransferase
VGAGLDVVIVSYRCRELLRDCLAALLGEGRPSRSVAVTVVDNDSRDGTVETVEREFPDVQVVAAAENVGFSRANNIGIPRGAAPYVLILNPDTRVRAGSLDRLLNLMDERTDVGIAGCCLQLEDGTLDHASRRSFPTPLSALGHFTGIGQRPEATGRLADYRAPLVSEGPVDAVNGAFMLVRRVAFEEVGLFDEGYWMYMEDLDLCYRFQQSGWTTWYEPGATVDHVKAGTSGKLRRPRLNYHFHYGMLRFYRKHYARDHNRLVNASVYTGIGVKLALSLVRTEVRRLADFWSGRRPTRPRAVARER